MGHLINPVSFRLYNTRYWNNNWSLVNNLNFSYLTIQDILIYNFFKKFFKKYLKCTNWGMMFVNLKIIRVFNSMIFYLYIHDSFLDVFMHDLSKKGILYRYFKRIKRKNSKTYNGIVEKLLKSSKNITPRNKNYLVKKFMQKKFKVIYKNLFYIFLKNYFLGRFWKTIKKIIFWYLKKFNNSFFISNMYILNLTKNNVNANIISEYINVRLKQYYTIFEILRSINYFLNYLLFKKKIIKGYKITCSGRFSRKQRATYSWKTVGSLSFSSIKSNLDYSFTNLALKYSNCTIKVWIRLNKKKKNLIEFVI